MEIRTTQSELIKQLATRPPLMMLDEVVLSPDQGQAEGTRILRDDEEIFQGHFPGHPILPGVLQVAAMEQLSQLLFQELFPTLPSPVLYALRKVRFKNPAVPGTKIFFHCIYRKDLSKDDFYVFDCKNQTPDGITLSSGILTFVPAEKQADLFDQATTGKKVSPLPYQLNTDRQKLMEILPHRSPFLLLDDAALNSDLTQPQIGVKAISEKDSFVIAASPACYKPYLAIESAAQLGLAAILSQPAYRDNLGVFMSIDSACFRRAAVPGEQLVFQCQLDYQSPCGMANGQFFVKEELITTAEIKFALVPRSR